jgi:hypothetical protein
MVREEDDTNVYQSLSPFQEADATAASSPMPTDEVIPPTASPESVGAFADLSPSEVATVDDANDDKTERDPLRQQAKKEAEEGGALGTIARFFGFGRKKK